MIRIMYGDLDVDETTDAEALWQFVVWMHDRDEWHLVDPFPLAHPPVLEVREQPEIVTLLDTMRRIAAADGGVVLDVGVVRTSEAEIGPDPQAWAEALWTRTAG